MYDVHLLCSGALRLNLDSSKVQDDFIALGTSRLHLYAVFVVMTLVLLVFLLVLCGLSEYSVLVQYR